MRSKTFEEFGKPVANSGASRYILGHDLSFLFSMERQRYIQITYPSQHVEIKRAISNTDLLQKEITWISDFAIDCD